MRIKLRKADKYWIVEFRGERKIFEQYEGATNYALKIWKRYYKEQAAYSMLLGISINLLSVEEAEFYTKLSKSKCKGISKAQYGYLKGIHERQEREF